MSVRIQDASRAGRTGPPGWAWGFALGLVALAALASAGVLARRADFEAPGRTPVEVVLDWPALAASASEWDVDPAAFLGHLAREGVTTLALPEQTAGLLADLGEGLLVSERQWRALRQSLGGASAPEGRTPRPPTGSVLVLDGGQTVPIPAELPEARTWGVGFPREGIEAARQAGLALLLRFGDRPRLEGPVEGALVSGQPAGAQPDRLEFRAVASAAGGARDGGTPLLRLSRVALFEGSRLPPPDQASGLLPAQGAVGLIEFSDQAGAAELAWQLGLRAVRVHSMRAEEITALGPRASAARYVRAVRERGVRVLYLRPAPTPQATLAMVGELRRGLAAAGFRLGLWEATPGFPGPTAAEAGAAAAGAVGLALLAVLAWARAAGAQAVASAGPQGVAPPGAHTLAPAGMQDRPAAAPPGFGLLAAAGVGAAMVLAAAVGLAQASGWTSWPSVLARQASALAVAVAGPVAATGAALAAAGVAGGGLGGHRLPGLRRASAVIAGVAAFVAVTLAAGATAGALLSDAQFMLRLQQFRGVKLAHAVPLVAVAAATAWATGLAPAALWRRTLRPVRWVDAMVGLGVLAAGWYYLARTGNELAPVSAVERWMRGWLEQAMEVRPRTKEFVVGYPALALALGVWLSAAARRWPALAAGLTTAATVAAVSVINSWVHLHTPVAITLQRTANGLALGLVAGAAAWGAVAVSIRLFAGRLAAPEGEAASESGPFGVLRVRQPGR